MIISYLNIFKGIQIMNPNQSFKNAYFVVLIPLTMMEIILELLIWYVVLRRRRIEMDEKKIRKSVC